MTHSVSVVKKIVKQAEAEGWSTRRTTDGFMFFPPDKDMPPIVVHLTPSDLNGVRAALRDLRRAGFHGGKLGRSV